MTQPCGLAFLKELNIQPVATTTEQDTVLEILERHKGEWIGIQQLTNEISEAIGAPFTERKVGAMLKELRFIMRKLDATGKAQVLITPSILEAHLKNSEPSESSES